MLKYWYYFKFFLFKDQVLIVKNKYDFSYRIRIINKNNIYYTTWFCGIYLNLNEFNNKKEVFLAKSCFSKNQNKLKIFIDMFNFDNYSRLYPVRCIKLEGNLCEKLIYL